MGCKQYEKKSQAPFGGSYLYHTSSLCPWKKIVANVNRQFQFKEQFLNSKELNVYKKCEVLYRGWGGVMVREMLNANFLFFNVE